MAKDSPMPDRRPPAAKLFTRFSDISPRKTEWLWQGRIPLGEITIVDGDPATNKSSALLGIAARGSKGWGMPDGNDTGKWATLLLAGEDSPEKTVFPRLRAAGADMRRVAVMNGDVTVPGSLTEIESAAVQIGARLVIVDPFMEFLGCDSHKDQKVRQAMGPLKRFAERTDLAVVLIRHLVKSGGRSAMYRGAGSIGIIAAARSGLLIAQSPDDPHMRVLAQFKSNLGPISPSLLFEPVTNGAGIVKIEWRGLCQFTAKDLLSPRKNGEGKLGDAKSLSPKGTEGWTGQAGGDQAGG